MKLEGSLDAFSLADVLNLLNATGKSGALSVQNEGRTAVIHLVEGHIAAASGGAMGALALVRRLVAQGAVSEDALSDAAMTSAESGDGLVASLLKAEAIRQDVAHDTAQALALDTVFDVLRWHDGMFSFAAEERPADDVGLRATPEQLIADAAERTVAWDAATASVPSPSAVPHAVAVGADVALSAEEWALLVLVDGHRSVEDVVDLSGRGTFAVVTCLVDLAERGLLDFSGPSDEHPLQTRLDMLQMLDVAAAQVVDESDGPRPDESEDPVPADVVAPHDADDAQSAIAADPAKVSRPVDTVPAAPAPSGGSTIVTVPAASVESRQLADTSASLLGGPHVPGDVVPPRPEPFLPTRRPDHNEPSAVDAATVDSTGLGFVGANAVVTEVMSEPQPADHGNEVQINRSMVLRLIAGVRGL